MEKYLIKLIRHCYTLSKDISFFSTPKCLFHFANMLFESFDITLKYSSFVYRLIVNINAPIGFCGRAQYPKTCLHLLHCFAKCQSKKQVNKRKMIILKLV